MTTKSKLVVIGNGMAGARMVEEILARGGGDTFDIVMFGEEPYGNYNRILLSDVLNGSHEEPTSSQSPRLVRRESVKFCTLGSASTKNLCATLKFVKGEGGVVEKYDHLIIATGSLPFVPPIEGLRRSDGREKQGIFRSAIG